MTFFVALLKGIFLSIGFVIGFIVMIVLLIKIAKKGKKRVYNPADLLESFKEYQIKIEKDQLFEQMTEVKDIISTLESGKVPDIVDQYLIKKDVALQTTDDEGVLTLKPITKYTIIKKIENVEKNNNTNK